MFVKQGDKISIIESAEFDKKLTKGNYLVKQDPMSGEFYLTRMDDFTIPSKVYGNPQAYVDRYFNTFKSRKGNLGILLGGVKGTGKSLLAKMLCNQSNLPVIVITEPYGGSGFKQFLAQIKQECVVFMDEFEKVYHNSQAQQQLLSVLDGVFEGKKMFLLTANTMEVSQFLTNRTGRIYYSREYTGLSHEIISDVIDDLLINKDNKELLLRDLMTVGQINMDILISIISEMNRYNETSTKSLSFLNIFPEKVLYSVEGFIAVEELIDNPTKDSMGNIEWSNQDNYNTSRVKASTTFHGNPLVNLGEGWVHCDFYYKDSKGENQSTEINWESNNVKATVQNNSILFKNEKTGEYLKYEPVVRVSKTKISSDSFIAKEGVGVNKGNSSHVREGLLSNEPVMSKEVLSFDEFLENRG